MSAERQTLLLIGDVHDEIGRLERSLGLVDAAGADLVLLTGDVGVDPPWHRAQRRSQRQAHDESVRRILGRVREVCDCPVVFVPGNHDLDDPPADAGGINVDGRILPVAGLSVAGFGGAGPTRFGFAYEWPEEQADETLRRLAALDEPVDILLSHTPPVDSGLDLTAHGQSVGSRAVKRWLPRLRPKLFVCGHIHEAWGLRILEGIPCINAGGLGEPYGRDLAWVVDWCGGPQSVRAVYATGEGRDERRWERLNEA